MLVYVPGIDGSGELLLETAERLRERFRLVQVEYVDGVGYGKDTVSDLAASLRQVLDKLGIERALLLAESFGGPVALQFALKHSEVVRGVAIVNSFAYYPRRFDLVMSRIGAKLLPSSVFRFVRPLIAARKLFGRLCEPDALRRFKERETPNFDANYRTRLRAIREIDLRSRLGEITVPVALFASERDRVVPSVACLTEMQAGLQDATLRTIPDGGHVALPLQNLPWCEWLLELHERSPA